MSSINASLGNSEENIFQFTVDLIIYFNCLISFEAFFIADEDWEE